MAESGRYLKTKTNLDLGGIMGEVQKDYQRTMNKIIFDYYLTDSRGRELIPIDLNLPPQEEQVKPTPYYGMVPIHPHDFPEQFSNFTFNSLLIKDEVIRSLDDI